MTEKALVPNVANAPVLALLASDDYARSVALSDFARKCTASPLACVRMQRRAAGGHISASSSGTQHKRVVHDSW